ncbi:MAG: hypothetical protein IJA12_00095 [Oscillospiraceae bacterium]|nr:hypothetical protein [Oscillospiraceae bacterium]
MKLKWLLTALLSVLVLSLISGSFVTWIHSSIEPELCNDLKVVDKNNIYAIDFQTDEQMHNIYRCDSKGENAVIIRAEAEKNERRYLYDELIYDEIQDKMYIHVSEYACLTGLLEKEEVFYCNFESGELEPAWEIVSEDGEQLYSMAETCMVQDGILYYLELGDGEDIVHCQDGDSSRIIRTITGSDDAVFSEYNFHSGGRLSAFSTDMGLYCEENGVWTQKYGVTDIKASYAGFTYGSKEVTFLDLKRQIQIRYNVSREKEYINNEVEFDISAVSDENGYKSTLTSDMLDCCQIISEDEFAASTELPEGLTNDSKRLNSGLMVKEKENAYIYTEIKLSKDMLSDYRLLMTVMFLIGYIVIAAVIILSVILFRKRKFVPIQIEITIFAVILFAGGIGFTAYQINNLLTQSFNDSYQDVFDDLEREMEKEMASILMKMPDEWNDSCITDSEFQEKIGYIMSNTILKNPETGEMEFAPYFVLHILNRDDELIMAYNSSGKKNIPTSYVYHNSDIKNEYASVLDTGKSRNFTQYDKEGVWNVQLCSFNYGNFNSVIEIGIDQYLTDWKTNQITMKIIKFAIVLCSVMVAAIIIFLGFSFSPLQKLGTQVKSGNIEKPKKLRYSREILSIWEQLYVMIENAKHRQSQLEYNNQQHYRFISKRLVNLVGAKELDEAVPGKYRRIASEFVCLTFPEEAAEKIRSFIAEIYELAGYEDGIVYKVTPKKILWIFTGNKNNVSDFIGILYDVFEKNGITCGIAAGSGKALIYVRGTEQHSDIAVSQSEADFTEELSEFAFASGGKCMTTGKFIPLVSEDEFDLIEESEFNGQTIYIIRRSPERRTQFLNEN